MEGFEWYFKYADSLQVTEATNFMKGLLGDKSLHSILRAILLAVASKIPRSKDHIFAILQAAQLLERLKMKVEGENYYRVAAELHA
jgi:hypothetical protein